MSCFGPVLGWSEQSIDDDDHPSVSLRQVITHTWTGCLVSYIATTWHQCTVGWHTHIHLTSHFGLVYVELIYIASLVGCLILKKIFYIIQTLCYIWLVLLQLMKGQRFACYLNSETNDLTSSLYRLTHHEDSSLLCLTLKHQDEDDSWWWQMCQALIFYLCSMKNVGENSLI